MSTYEVWGSEADKDRRRQLCFGLSSIKAVVAVQGQLIAQGYSDCVIVQRPQIIRLPLTQENN